MRLYEKKPVVITDESIQSHGYKEVEFKNGSKFKASTLEYELKENPNSSYILVPEGNNPIMHGFGKKEANKKIIIGDFDINGTEDIAVVTDGKGYLYLMYETSFEDRLINWWRKDGFAGLNNVFYPYAEVGETSDLIYEVEIDDYPSVAEIEDDCSHCYSSFKKISDLRTESWSKKVFQNSFLSVASSCKGATPKELDRLLNLYAPNEVDEASDAYIYTIDNSKSHNSYMKKFSHFNKLIKQKTWNKVIDIIINAEKGDHIHLAVILFANHRNTPVPGHILKSAVRGFANINVNFGHQNYYNIFVPNMVDELIKLEAWDEINAILVTCKARLIRIGPVLAEKVLQANDEKLEPPSDVIKNATLCDKISYGDDYLAFMATNFKRGFDILLERGAYDEIEEVFKNTYSERSERALCQKILDTNDKKRVSSDIIALVDRYSNYVELNWSVRRKIKGRVLGILVEREAWEKITNILNNYLTQGKDPLPDGVYEIYDSRYHDEKLFVVTQWVTLMDKLLQSINNKENVPLSLKSLADKVHARFKKVQTQVGDLVEEHKKIEEKARRSTRERPSSPFQDCFGQSYSQCVRENNRTWQRLYGD